MIWTAAYNTSFIAGYLVIEMAVFGSSGDENQSAVSPLLGALNKNGLVVFLAVSVCLVTRGRRMLTFSTGSAVLGEPLDRTNQHDDANHVRQ